MATKAAQHISPELKVYIAEYVQEVLSDPDFGLELRPEIKRRLRASVRKNQKTISFEGLKRKYL